MNKEQFGEGFLPQAVSPENPEKLSLLRQELLKLKGATVEELPKTENLKAQQVFLLRVNDRKKWESAAERKRLIEIFGERAFEAFEPPDNIRQYNASDKELLEQASDSVEANMQPADKVFFIADQEKVAGFLAVEDWPLKDGTQARYVHMLSVDQEKKSQGYGRELYRLAFEQAGVSSFVGVSFRPQAVKNRLKIGEEFGYQGFYCGNKNGEFGNLGTAEEQAKVKELSALMIEKSREWEMLADKEAPEGYAVWKGADTLPPLKEEDINFTPNDPLDKTFREGVLKLQTEVAPDVAFGILINIKKEK